MRSAADDGWTVSEGRAPSDWGFALDHAGLQVLLPPPAQEPSPLASMMQSFLCVCLLQMQSPTCIEEGGYPNAGGKPAEIGGTAGQER